MKRRIVKSFTALFLPLLVVALGCVAPRLCVLGELPTTDEGIYVFLSQYAFLSLKNSSFPSQGPLALYPLLGAWLFHFSGNHFVMFRLFDLCMAAIASYLLFRILKRESGSEGLGAFLSLVCLSIMNQPIFVQNGFKNSMFIAYIPLFWAFDLVQRAKEGGGVQRLKPWFFAGALSAISVLLRETYFYFPLVALVSISFTKQMRPLLSYLLGIGMTMGLSLVVLFSLRGGDVYHFLEWMQEMNKVYSSISHERIPFFIKHGWQAFYVSLHVFVLAGLSFAVFAAYIWITRQTVRHIVPRLFFWLLIFAVPLLEPYFKIGFPYHFSVCIPGLGGFIACLWRILATDERFYRPMATRLGILPVGLGVAFLIFLGKIPIDKVWSGIHGASARIESWTAQDIAHSNYLLAANKIRSVSRSGQTLSISGFMLALYPLTGLQPPSFGMHNLTSTLIRFDGDEQRMVEALRACPADFVMTTTRSDWVGAEVLLKAVETSGMYQKIGDVPNDDNKAYGNFGGTIYRKRDGSGSCSDSKVL